MTHHADNKTRLYLGAVLVVTTVLLARGFVDSGFIYSDDARHTMDGVFFMDYLFRDLPLRTTYDYATQYYTKYPALGIGYYPPFFALIEAPFLKLFGISIMSARLCVAAFTLVGVVFLFRLVRDIFDEETALYSTLLFITTPFVVKWAGGVMLEMPTTALLILATYGFYHFIEHESRAHGILMVLATAAAGYTKQTAAFIVPVFIIYAVLNGHARRFLKLDTILLALLLVVLVVPLGIMTMTFGEMNVAQTVAVDEPGRLYTLEQWYLYPKFIASILTPPALVLAVVSIVWTALSPDRKRTLLFVAWIIGFYITFVYIAQKIPRYAYFWIPPFMVFAALLVRRTKATIKGVRVASVMLAVVVAYQFVASFVMDRPYIRGYADAARHITSIDGLDRVFYHGSANGNGNFIFNIRRLDADRSMVVIRGDKVLATASINPDNMLEEHATTTEEVRKIIDDIGVNYFVIDRKAHYNITPYVLLRRLLETDDFVVERTIPVESSFWWLEGEEIVIYRRARPVASTKENLRLRLPIIGTEMTTPLDQLNNFYTPSSL